MFRTPSIVLRAQGSSGSPRSAEKAGPLPDAKRRISFGDDTPPAASQGGPATPGTRRAATNASRPPKNPEARHRSRTEEARACLNKAKLNLGNSRNLKAEIKTAVLEAINRIYELVKEAEAERSKFPAVPVPTVVPAVTPAAAPLRPTIDEPTELMKQLMANLQQHNQALEECKQHTRALSERLQQAPRYVAGQGPTFAEMAAGPKQVIQEPLHSVVVSSVNEQDTGEEVIEKLRKAVDARNEGTRVERLRKARDQKVVVGFKTREELNRVTERIRKAGNLVVEEVRNKDPLIIVKDVLSCHTDVEVIQALQRQNTHLIGDIPAEDVRLGVKYRRRTRNPHMCHVILQVSPTIWQRLTMAGRVHIDLQRVRVLDQSPLVQCTRCLCFGHSRKLCTQPADLCIHCGEPHMQADCPSRLAGEAPRCQNCLSAKLDKIDHSAFDSGCPIRVKWDALARLSVAYC